MTRIETNGCERCDRWAFVEIIEGLCTHCIKILEYDEIKKDK